LTYLTWQHEHNNARQNLQSALDFQLHQTTSRIEQRIAAYEEMLRGIQGFLAVTDNVRRSDFSDYVASLQLGADFSGLLAIELVQLSDTDSIGELVGHLRRSGYPDYRIWPEGQRDIYAPIVQVEPAIGKNLRVMGYDPFDDPPRRKAMEQARASGLIALSGKVKLALENSSEGTPGFVLALPIFKRGAPHDSPLARMTNTTGWILAVFKTNEFMASLYGEDIDGLMTEIYDGVTATAETRLFPATGIDMPAMAPSLSASEFVVNAGHSWTVIVRGSPGFTTQFGKDTSNVIALAGTGLGILLALVGWQMATTRERAQYIAETMTRELKESEECWKFALEGAGDGVWDWHILAGKLNYSERWKAALGDDGEDRHSFIDRWTSLIHPDDLPAERNSLRACLAGTVPIYLSEHRIRWMDGSWRWMSVRGMVVSRDADGVPVRMIGTISDISERKATEERIQHMAQHDPLTNLPNRALFSDRLNLALARAKREHSHAALLFVDLDNFKPVNDLRGHDVGDLVLKEVAHRMLQCVRDSDTIGRIGGDEFVILLPSIGSREDALLVAEKIRLAIAQHFDIAGLRLEISSSIGIALFPEDGEDALTIAKNADDAMYRAKQTGRNKVQFYSYDVFSGAPNTLT
jgi:diguanylate cyclase (GGDEF)-like protein